MTQFLILDVETNGFGAFQPPKQRIVQISWITCEDEERNYFIKGARFISPDVPHTITVDFLNSQGIEFDEALKVFLQDLEYTDKIVAHNVDFDVGCLLNELDIRGYSKSVRNKITEVPTYCTMKNSVEFCHLPKTGLGAAYPGWKWPKLSEAYSAILMKPVPPGLHDSLQDCRVLREIYLKGLELGVFAWD
jgi:DNA polymerase-3 subunit alpha/DNA polymerase-3 subunit epsilon